MTVHLHGVPSSLLPLLRGEEGFSVDMESPHLISPVVYVNARGEVVALVDIPKGCYIGLIPGGCNELSEKCDFIHPAQNIHYLNIRHPSTGETNTLLYSVNDVIQGGRFFGGFGEKRKAEGEPESEKEDKRRRVETTLDPAILYDPATVSAPLDITSLDGLGNMSVIVNLNDMQRYVVLANTKIEDQMTGLPESEKRDVALERSTAVDPLELEGLLYVLVFKNQGIKGNVKFGFESIVSDDVVDSGTGRDEDKMEIDEKDGDDNEESSDEYDEVDRGFILNDEDYQFKPSKKSGEPTTRRRTRLDTGINNTLILIENINVLAGKDKVRGNLARENIAATLFDKNGHIIPDTVIELVQKLYQNEIGPDAINLEAKATLVYMSHVDLDGYYGNLFKRETFNSCLTYPSRSYSSYLHSV